MAIGQVTALIVALAFLGLVVMLVIFLINLMKTIRKVNQSISSLDKSINGIAKQSERVLAASDALIDEVNRKFKVLSPAFKAIADLGRSASALNDSTNRMVRKVGYHRKLKKSLLAKLGGVIWRLFGWKNR